MELEALWAWLCGNSGTSTIAIIVAVAALFGVKLPSPVKSKPVAEPIQAKPEYVYAEEKPKAIDPATIGIIFMLLREFAPVLLDWIRERRKPRTESTE